MSTAHRGKQSFLFPHYPAVVSYASVVGRKEAEGPLGKSFDLSMEKGHFGQDSWEKAESHMQRTALSLALQKGGLKEQELDAVFLGDLLNQCIGSGYSMREKKIPTFGLYGACSTMAESLILGAMAVDGGYCHRVASMTSSHFASSERQFRFPLGYGGQRTPTAQWTVTGAGAVILGQVGDGPYIRSATVGGIYDPGIKDANNMGAAMAPAAFETLCAHFRDLECKPEDYDLILTGDLGSLGSQALRDLMAREGYALGENYKDCGVMIYDLEAQDVHCGGSGCGCSASVLCGYILDKLRRRELQKLLFCGTGALLSPVSVQQGESIPGVCHAVALCTDNTVS